MNQNVFRLALIACVMAAVPLLAIAQQSGSASVAPRHPPPNARAASVDRTNADETFELNIRERRITERDFEASTSVEINEETEGGLRLRVGVAVGAEEINVLLRNVRGRVRFRGSLERVLERLNLRRAPAATP